MIPVSTGVGPFLWFRCGEAVGYILALPNIGSATSE
jgi:hypothetical protein